MNLFIAKKKKGLNSICVYSKYKQISNIILKPLVNIFKRQATTAAAANTETAKCHKASKQQN